MLNRFSSTPQQQQYIRKCFSKNLRVDGRGNSQYREIVYKNSNLQHLPGSAYSYINHEDVEIYVGVKAKIQKKNTAKNSFDIQDIVRLELGCMQKLDDDQNEEMSTMERILQRSYLNRIFGAMMNDKQTYKQLTIPHSTQHILVIFIDVFLLANPHISQMELIQKTISIALKNTEIADLKATTNKITKQEKVQILPTSHKLTIKANCVLTVIGIVNQQFTNKFGQTQKISQFVLDLSRQQYEAVGKVLAIIIDRQNQRVQEIQILKGKVNPNQISKCVSFVLGQIKAE